MPPDFRISPHTMGRPRTPTPRLPGIDACVVCLSGTGLAVARALGRRGLRVLGIDPRPWRAGHHSRHVLSRTQLHVRTVRNPTRSARPPLIPCGDPELLWAISHATDLAPHVRLPPGLLDGSTARILDKRQLYARCQQLNIPIAPTWIPTSTLPQIPLPALVKPPPGGGKPTLCRTRRALKKAASPLHQVAIQSLIPGPTTALEVCAVYLSSSGAPGPIVTGRKLRQRPSRFGSASRLRAYPNPEVAQKSLALLAALGATGPCSVEWKRHQGRLHLIEINPRPALWWATADAVTWDMYCDLSGRPRPAPGLSQTRQTWRYALRDPIGPTADRYCLWARDDPMPVFFGPREAVYSLKAILSRQ